MLIIDYGMGNLRSVTLALKKLGSSSFISENPRDIHRETEGIILPGVGSFGQAMANLRDRGLVEPLQEYLRSGYPFLGICLGFQILFSRGEEGGGVEGLDVFPGKVVSFPQNGTLKVPHMGWNQIHFLHPDPLLHGVLDGGYQYFVHSYYVRPEVEIALFKTTYGQDFISGISKGQIYGVQFHPEKGGEMGLLLLSNFIGICREG